MLLYFHGVLSVVNTAELKPTQVSACVSHLFASQPPLFLIECEQILTNS